MVNRNEYIMVSLVYKGHQYYKSFGAVFIIIRLSCSLLIRTILSLLLKTKINKDETVLVFSKTRRNRMTMTKKNITDVSPQSGTIHTKFTTEVPHLNM